MRHFRLLLFLLPVLAYPATSRYVVLEFEGTIGPVSDRYIANGIDKAEELDADFILLKLDTPGGLDESMRAIVKKIMASPIPVVGYVYPAGGRAASAGVFIMLSAHVAAMAPGTNMGAAHPVAMGGQQPDSIMMGKIENDAVAFIRSIAEERGRDADWAERAVRESISAAANQALELGLIDYIASSPEELIEKLDGHMVKMGEEEVVLQTADAEEIEIGLRWYERLLRVLANPNLIYILLMIGIYGVIAWVQNPGSILPGVVGIIALIFAFYGLQVLPINYAGLALIAVALILFILEVKITSYGMLTIGGIVSLVLGTLLMFQSTPSFYGISWPVIITIMGLVVALFVLIIWLAIRTHVRKPTTGQRGMVGLVGEARSDLDPEGSVYIRGEYWTGVVASGKIKKGTKVKVVAMDGMTLKVEKAP
ncbi:MAG: nodulation protein NfeD [Candidatus Stahlbacteria bacterium]|nr:MAG: nodulation protein NfeD [Candidatus Stahlbacteria bacterium]